MTEAEGPDVHDSCSFISVCVYFSPGNCHNHLPYVSFMSINEHAYGHYSCSEQYFEQTCSGRHLNRLKIRIKDSKTAENEGLMQDSLTEQAY